jgi:DNA (cytosine-5)-methyltransferase 1
VTAYYNEFDPYAAAWLRNLIAAGHIAPGDVDERSILDVKPDDLRGYTQCHFFAGIGGWSLGLRLAGFPDDRPIWSGSCPCQPFSAAGKQRGSDDERHLWPAFFDLIRECRPGAVVGEQVAGAAGAAWWDHVAADLEGADYAAASANLGAHSVGALHIRQRLYWVAHADSAEQQTRFAIACAEGQADAGCDCASSHLAHAESRGQRINGSAPWQAGHTAQCDAGKLDNAQQPRLEGRNAPSDVELHGAAGALRPVAAPSVLDPWRDLEWLPCTDGKARPAQRGIRPLVDGLPGGRVAVGSAIQQAGLTDEEAAHQFSRVGVLRGAGNAIVPQVAAVFIEAALAQGVVV